MPKNIIFILFLFPILLFSQSVPDSIQKLDEVIIDAKRIALPFTENAHTIEVIDSLEMSIFRATSMEEILQNSIGLDVRRRGVEGTQSDLYIRGGNYDQVLVLIDGVKMDDLQTGHHIMNAIIDPENIDRIEIIKGAASRIYGQNAMNGAINIITKRTSDDRGFIRFKAGSFETYGIGLGYADQLENSAIRFSINKLKSDGYRHNTDFNNWNGFFKAEFGNNEILATYGERAFGANGFYASPIYTEQYEETQTNLIAFKRKINFKNINSTAQIYWHRNEDFYLLKRNLPDFYKNKHTNQKTGIEWNGSYSHQWLTSAVGIDINYGEIKSSNLGMHDRITTTVFIEERIKSNDGIFAFTPGLSLNYYSDFGWFVYPGLDLGVKFKKNVKMYVNTGYTSRIPNFTNLYYNSPTEHGNTTLKPEKALTGELGFYLTPKRWIFNANYFYRHADDLIDWAKDSLNAPKWQARNFSNIVTQGVELSTKYHFNIKQFPQFAKIGYTYMNENILDEIPIITRYSLNSFKHQVVANLFSQYNKHLSHNISYRFVERTLHDTYNLVDVGINCKIDNWKMELNFNNIFNIDYSETNLVPMPGFHVMGNISFQF